jgi:hypothetical protein
VWDSLLRRNTGLSIGSVDTVLESLALTGCARGNWKFRKAIGNGKKWRPTAIVRIPQGHVEWVLTRMTCKKWPRSWQDVIDIAKAGGRAINLEMQANKRKAQKIVRGGGHHVVDEMTAVGLQLREVDDELIDDLLGQGLLDEDDEQQSASMGDEN